VDFSQITDYLYIGDIPRADDYDILRNLGVRLVIDMCFDKPPVIDLHRPPLDLLWLPAFDSPRLVIPIWLLKCGVRAALKTFQAGGKVYAHCKKGRHRGPAMGASILIARGYDPQQAIDLIKLQRPIADPDVYYIRSRILRFAHAWEKSN
jgi:hypothetical protein